MKSRSPVKKLAAAAVAATALVGCGLGANAPDPRPAVVPPPVEWSQPAFEVLVEDSDASKAHAEFFAKLALTEAQKTQIKGVIRDALKRMEPLREAMKPLVTGKTVDRAALSAGIAKALKADAEQDAQTMAELRAVLTDAQRKLLADTLTEMGTRQDDPHTKIFEKLMDKAADQIQMTEDQKMDFAQVKADFLEFWKTHRAAYMTSMAKFMHDGKQHDLHHEFERLNAKLSTDSMVAFVSELDQSQRQKLVAWKESWLDKIASKLK
jgi:hypothetical protein